VDERERAVEEAKSRGGDESAAVPPLSDEAIRAMQQTRFQERVQRVQEVMQRERVDWRGVPFIAPDGRIGVRVVPVEVQL
jgi:hypothetical protein